MVTGLLSVPSARTGRLPVVILLHGVGDSKQVDYIEAGHDYLTAAGYAVMRIDISNHGDRKIDDYDFSFTEGYRFWTRDIMSQTVFDLRRTVDFLSTRPEIDPERIGYYGISLGGFIGTVFCAVDKRVKVPVIALAGGNINLRFGMDALDASTKNYLSIIDPINFVSMIHPRPLLMINAEEDEVIPPIMSKLLYAKAREPKKIIWYPSRHRSLPIDKAYPDGIKWFEEHL
jgi:dienelactone hydrolase